VTDLEYSQATFGATQSARRQLLFAMFGSELNVMLKEYNLTAK